MRPIPGRRYWWKRPSVPIAEQKPSPRSIEARGFIAGNRGKWCGHEIRPARLRCSLYGAFTSGGTVAARCERTGCGAVASPGVSFRWYGLGGFGGADDRGAGRPWVPARQDCRGWRPDLHRDAERSADDRDRAVRRAGPVEDPRVGPDRGREHARDLSRDEDHPRRGVRRARSGRRELRLPICRRQAHRLRSGGSSRGKGHDCRHVESQRRGTGARRSPSASSSVRTTNRLPGSRSRNGAFAASVRSRPSFPSPP